MADQGEIFLEWVNAVKVVETPVQSVSDLSDGRAMAQILHHFLPDRFPPPNDSADPSTRLQMLCTELDTHLNGKLSMTIQGHAGAASGDHSALLFRILEAVVLASAEGPNNQEAVGAILALSEATQHAMMGLLQQLMQLEAPADAGADASPAASQQRRASLAPRRASNFSEMDPLRCELQDLRARFEEEDLRAKTAEQNEKAAYEQLLDVRQHGHAAEDTAQEHSNRLALFRKQHGEELRKQEKDMQELRRELQEIHAGAGDVPKEHDRLRRVLDQEMDEAAALRNQAHEMEEQVDSAMQVDYHDSDHLKKEQADYTAELTHVAGEVFAVTEAEIALRDKATEMLQELRDTEDEAMTRDSDARNFRRRGEAEEESMADVLGLLAFRESEMQQVVDGLEKELQGAGAKKKKSDAVVMSAQEMLKLYSELAQVGQTQNELDNMKRTIVVKADKLDLLLGRLESQVKDPVVLSQTRIMAEEVAQSSDFGAAQKRKDNEKARLSQETSELKKAQDQLKNEEASVKQLAVQVQAEAGLTEKALEDGRLRLQEAEAKERAEILADEEREKEQEAAAAAAQKAVDEATAEAARQRALAEAAVVAQAAAAAQALADGQAAAAAAAEAAAQEAAARAAAAEQAEIDAKAQMVQLQKAHAEAQALADGESEKQSEVDEENNKEALGLLKENLMAREKNLHTLKKQCDLRKVAIRKEARLMLAVYHELSMRYHQLFSQYGALAEDLERRGL